MHGLRAWIRLRNYDKGYVELWSKVNLWSKNPRNYKTKKILKDGNTGNNFLTRIHEVSLNSKVL